MVVFFFEAELSIFGVFLREHTFLFGSRGRGRLRVCIYFLLERISRSAHICILISHIFRHEVVHTCAFCPIISNIRSALIAR
jgi:hypothetical protein